MPRQVLAFLLYPAARMHFHAQRGNEVKFGILGVGVLRLLPFL